MPPHIHPTASSFPSRHATSPTMDSARSLSSFPHTGSKLSLALGPSRLPCPRHLAIPTSRLMALLPLSQTLAPSRGRRTVLHLLSTLHWHPWSAEGPSARTRALDTFLRLALRSRTTPTMMLTDLAVLSSSPLCITVLRSTRPPLLSRNPAMRKSTITSDLSMFITTRCRTLVPSAYRSVRCQVSTPSPSRYCRFHPHRVLRLAR
jgi:hypothetical protein